MPDFQKSPNKEHIITKTWHFFLLLRTLFTSGKKYLLGKHAGCTWLHLDYFLLGGASIHREFAEGEKFYPRADIAYLICRGRGVEFSLASPC